MVPQFTIPEFLTLEGTFNLDSADLCCQGIYLQGNAGDPRAVQTACGPCLPGHYRTLGSKEVNGNEGLSRDQEVKTLIAQEDGVVP